jgi:hypothetical protein
VSRLLRIALAAAAIAALPLHATAGGYGKTTWGMTAEQVKKLYPAGTREAEPDGTVSYFVLQTVEGLKAVVGFTFEHGRLTYVAVRFPMPGTPIDMKAPRYAIPTNERAQGIASMLRKALEARYGAPFVDGEKGELASNPHVKAAWVTPDGGTMLTLDFQPMPDGPFTSVGVSYGEWVPKDAGPAGTKK